MGCRWAVGRGFTANEIQTLSRVWPIWMFVQSLSIRRGLIVDFLKPVQSLSKSNDCLEIVQREEFGFWAFSFGQSLDKFWIYMSNLRPCSLSLDRSRTDSVPLWTESGQGLYFSIHWTHFWQTFDRVWTEIGFHIQSLSNQPMGNSKYQIIEFVKSRSSSSSVRQESKARSTAFGFPPKFQT